MELTNLLAFLAVVLPVAYGAPSDATRDLHPKLLEAMKRDLGLNAEQAHAQVAQDLELTTVIEHAQNTMRDSFNGAWISDNKVHIGVTGQAAADEVIAVGGVPVVMRTPLSKLRDAQSVLDSIFTTQASSLTATANSGIAAYYVNVASNKLIIEALEGSRTDAAELAAQAGLTASEFEVRTVAEMPQTFATVRGGNAYYIGRGRCSIGFSVSGGFVTAGHCGSKGTAVQATSGGATLGTVAGAVFPGNADMGHVKTVSGTTLSGTINGYGGADIRVSGSQEAAVGGKVCRSGSTTGVHCGTIQEKNASVRYPEGTITGLTKTNACAEGGDSGGSWYVGGQAQGVTSGGSGNCKQGGTTYFQPLGEILSTYGLSLITG